ncbi:rhomboid family intramembrane serine protease [Clostridium beijerinckii]|uniref:Rhomboid family intramembrane serine protease n=1 Tax=Clostridium beijerinckii TaxID=1520 RepID=A0A1S9NCC2_CLOBE|nr:rhomboid family intramembrane serine protease [Clostridium beijerinckii]OOP75125.1 rhomboid family intramembrane serine protease [Clostridium beijerinckii]
MNNFKEEFYKILVNAENFYMKQYYSDFHKREIFLAIKELSNGIYCVLISEDENENIDFLEAFEYIKTLGKDFSLNMIVLSKGEYTNINKTVMVNKLIVDKENYTVIKCDESCLPLKEILELYINKSKVKNIDNKREFFRYKIPTMILILINVIIFIIMQIDIYNIKHSLGSSQLLSEEMINAINNSVLVTFGAKYNALINNGEVWRLLTCAFLHSSIIHIAFNMYSLYIVGPQIQQIYGAKKYLVIYITSCITASILSYLASPYTISVGASGGIFGLLGALLAFAIMERHRLQKKYISSLLQIILINLFIGLSVKNIDNYAHIGGLIGGALIGYVSYKILNKQLKN